MMGRSAVLGPAVRNARALVAGSNGPAWDLLLVSAAVLIVTAVARLHHVFPAISAARPVLVSGAAATALLLLDRHPARNLVALDSTLTRVLVAFLLWMAVTVPFALHDGRSFLFLFDAFAKTVLIYCVLVGTVRGLVDVNRLALSYFAGAATYALVVLVRFEVGNESWRLTNLYTYDPNDFATFAVTALPLGVYFTQRRNRPTLRIAAATGCVALVVAFVWAGSRGGFLALLGMLAVLLLHYRAIALTRRLLAGGLMVGAMLLVATDRYWSEMSSILDPTQDYNLTSETGRINVWKRGLGYVLERPVFGVGPSNFPVAEGVLSPLADRQQYGLGVRWTAPHKDRKSVV